MIADIQAPPSERAFAFLRTNRRDPKPRTRGVTEVRGPYYSPMGRRYLQDLLETMGEHVDSQIVQLECLRRGLWGTKSLWGRVLTYDRP